ncbi:MIP/aquaporin family protein [Desulfosporosinus sp. BICA1-9]|uniref:MIP/aquaporin family protein n=1 Tax=Desulfosporosinus sp. BICA1-9 TaxID=1531958 RepID=UPI00054C0D5B|nr:MIP/aquaporin family protein [Desulfosporosinus sp. BICA1-9]KJS47809.1 MAG: porin [Peptococcaceae bacterium BRH_c23]KJS85897.1 MAG: porin [Desulfosporosinus sp. BICA1-9]KJS90139.1 MAG: porin [Desulfosporosinus sp. BICA1-9]HBW38098.1 aquaporin family protein [Desulfosporosinus sp.]
MASLTKKFISELIGTWMLVTVGAGSAAVTLMLAEGEKKASTFNIGIGALGGLGDWLAIGLAFGIVIAAAIYIFGPVSGAHMNPAVTIALWISKRFPTGELIPYLVAQFVGASLGAVTILAMLGSKGATVGGLGAPGPFPGMSLTGVFIAELVGTFILMLTIMGIAVDKRAPQGWAGLIIGLIVAGLITTMGNISGQGINPARTFGPVFVDSLVGGPNGWSVYWIYLVAPIIGAILAVWLYDGVVKED